MTNESDGYSQLQRLYSALFESDNDDASLKVIEENQVLAQLKQAMTAMLSEFEQYHSQQQTLQDTLDQTDALRSKVASMVDELTPVIAAKAEKHRQDTDERKRSGDDFDEVGAEFEYRAMQMDLAGLALANMIDVRVTKATEKVADLSQRWEASKYQQHLSPLLDKIRPLHPKLAKVVGNIAMNEIMSFNEYLSILNKLFTTQQAIKASQPAARAKDYAAQTQLYTNLTQILVARLPAITTSIATLKGHNSAKEHELIGMKQSIQKFDRLTLKYGMASQRGRARDDSGAVV